MDEFENLPDDEFASLPDDTEIPKTESFLEKAIGATVNPFIKTGMDVLGGVVNKNPFQTAHGVIGGVSPSNAYEGMMAGKHELLAPTRAMNKAVAGPVSPALDFMGEVATDPMTYVGGKIAKETPGFLRNTLTKSEGEKEAVRDRLFKIMQGQYKKQTSIYGRALDESGATVDLSDIIPDSSGYKFTLRQAQEIKNTISEGIPEAIKSGIKVSSKYLNPSEVTKIISSRMKEAAPEMAGVMEKFGEKANAFKIGIKQFQPSTAGAEKIYGKPNIIGFKDPFLGGSGAREAINKFSPKVFSAARKARTGENWRRAGQAVAVGAPAWAMYNAVPSVFKQATRRAVEGL